MTIWKWFNKDYKIYTEDLTVQNQLKKFSKFKLHSEYFKDSKKIGEDFIFPASRMRQLEKLAADRELKITFVK